MATKKKDPKDLLVKPRDRVADSINAIELMDKGASPTQAMKQIANDRHPKLMELPQDTQLGRALRDKGIDYDYLAETLKRLLTARVKKIDKHGKIHETDNHNIQIKALELIIGIFGEKPKPVNQHMHIHSDLSQRELRAKLDALKGD